MSRLPRHAHVFAPELLEARVNPVSFSPGSSYLTGGNVMSVALGDVNNDGRLDMAAGVAGSGGVEVRLGDGGGHFTLASTVMMGFAESVKLADLNNDGKLDILAATPVNNSMVIALGNGDGTFQAPIINTLAYGAQDVAAADFNGDGKLDVVAAMPGGAAVMLNNSSGSVVQTPEYFDASGRPDGATVATGDFNGDGNQDFAVSLVGAAEVKVYLGDGTGGFATPFVYDNAGGAEGGRILAADFTGDGKVDLAIGYSDAPQLGLLAGNGDGTFQDPSLIDTSLACTGPIAMGDIDLDGDMDLVAMPAGSGNEVCLLNNGDGTFAAPVAVRYAFPGDTAIGDVTSDGLPDVIIANDLSPGLINVVVNTTRVVESFTVTAPTTGIAGDSFTVTVTARDNFGVTLTGYTGTVHFASSDAIAGLPADYQFTAADAGVHTFTVALRTAGDQSITINDLRMPTAVGLANVAVSAGATAQFKVEFSGSFAAGVAGTATVTAEDAFGNFTSDYSGTIHLASSDSQATLPPDAALAHGTGTFDITLRTAKDPSVTATDATDSTITGSAAATVTPGVATSLVATAPPDVATGKAFDFTVAAHDQFGNVATSYTGTVHFAGTDPRTSLPGFYHFTASDAG
ncbi:MAG TPA: FG-GAP-like repeat-containing protein, partial [Gemmata sp.]|nr:FG-GAP-like repeat-containing protein [Gemmata sp.]